MSSKNYITKTGYDLLVSERDELQHKDRPEVVKVVQWAASLGDRSENADYQYGKRRLREIDRRIRFLNTRINSAEIVEPGSIQSDKVRFSATVIIEDEDGEQKTYTIVGEDEINRESDFISWKSPIAKSLLGREVGDEVSTKTPDGVKEFTIISIQYAAL